MGTKTQVKPTLPAGFRDTAPEDMILKRHILSIIIAVFERFGFEPFDSATVHFLSVLFGEEEFSEMDYFRAFNTKHPERGDRPKMGLRYDLTLPLGRYVAEHYQELPRPFMRWQTGYAYRGETPTATRFNEFMQCDVDAVFAPGMISDAQIIALMDECMRALGVTTHVVLLNNRKILNCLPAYLGFEEKYLKAVLTVLDKKSKLNPGETLEGQLAALEKEEGGQLLDSTQAAKLLDFCNVTGSNTERVAAIRTLLLGNSLAVEGCNELDEVLGFLRLFGVAEEHVLVETFMVRGLGYYTGPIFETVLTDSPETGSIFSGGRYNDLVERFVEMPAPATGAAFGIDRFMVYAKGKELFKLTTSMARVLVAYMPSPGCLQMAITVAQVIRSWGVNTVLYDGADLGLRPQIGRAKMLDIPWVVIIGENELAIAKVALKDMRAHGQVLLRLDEVKDRILAS